MSEKKKSKKHPPSSNDFEPANDGADHVNIYSRGKTKLGKLMSNFAHTPFTYKGKTYQSVEGALYYYRTEDNRLITLHGSLAKKLGSSLKQKQIETPAMIKAWIYAKLFANPEIIDLLLQNNLPYSHYYVMYGKKIPAGISLPEIWREVTDELKHIFKHKTKNTMYTVRSKEEEHNRHEITMFLFEQLNADSVEYYYDEIGKTGKGFMVFKIISKGIKLIAALAEKEYLEFLDEQNIEYAHLLNKYDVYMDVVDNMFVFIDKTGKLKQLPAKIQAIKKVIL